jgi:hypothetical protein
MTVTRHLAERPWLFIVVAFLMLVSVWTAFIYLAVTNGPMTVPLDSTTASIHANR